jgi:hypothetical protein
VFDNVRTDRYLVQWTITGFQQQVSPVFTFEKGSSKIWVRCNWQKNPLFLML